MLSEARKKGWVSLVNIKGQSIPRRWNIKGKGPEADKNPANAGSHQVLNLGSLVSLPTIRECFAPLWAFESSPHQTDRHTHTPSTVAICSQSASHASYSPTLRNRLLDPSPLSSPSLFKIPKAPRGLSTLFLRPLPASLGKSWNLGRKSEKTKHL